MSSDSPRRRTRERFGSLNNLRSNPFSSKEKILDITQGVIDPFAQIAQSVLENSYTVDSLSRFGNTFNARVLAVTVGKPARHQYPDLYSNSTTVSAEGVREVPEYYICVLRDETDHFTPNPDDFSTNSESYVALAMMQGSAISDKPVTETLEPFGEGDIVEVYKPSQNSWNGARVKKVIVRNNFDIVLPPESLSSLPFLGGMVGQPFSRLGTTTTGRAPAGRSLGARPPGLVPVDGAGRIIVSGHNAENSIPMYGNVPVRYRLGNDGRPMDLSLPHRERNPPEEIKFITIHNCGWGFRSGRPGATRLGRYLAGEGFASDARQVSGHIGIDEQGIEQYLPLDKVGFHGGPQNGYSVGIDICQPYDPENHAGDMRRGNEMTPGLYTTGQNPTYDINRGPREIVNISEQNLEHTAQLLVALHAGLGLTPNYVSASEVTNGRGEFTIRQILDAGWTIVPHSATSLASVRYDISQWWDVVMTRFAEIWGST
jgi:hypothetical protein